MNNAMMNQLKEVLKNHPLSVFLCAFLDGKVDDDTNGFCLTTIATAIPAEDFQLYSDFSYWYFFER